MVQFKIDKEYANIILRYWSPKRFFLRASPFLKIGYLTFFAMLLGILFSPLRIIFVSGIPVFFMFVFYFYFWYKDATA